MNNFLRTAAVAILSLGAIAVAAPGASADSYSQYRRNAIQITQLLLTAEGYTDAAASLPESGHLYVLSNESIDTAFTSAQETCKKLRAEGTVYTAIENFDKMRKNFQVLSRGGRESGSEGMIQLAALLTSSHFLPPTGMCPEMFDLK
jgi:hypothetical protein